MRDFVSPKGDFILTIPNEWCYVNEMYGGGDIPSSSFELAENPIGCFQVLCKPKTTGSLHEMIMPNYLFPQKKATRNLVFTERYLNTETTNMVVWLALVEEQLLMCKYIYNNAVQKDELARELSRAKDCLKSIIIIPEKDKESVLERDRYHKFMTSLAAVNDLIYRAHENKSFIELVALLANKIDALLRLSLILKEQINNDTLTINTALIYQKEGDKIVFEKEIYKKALDKNIIDENLFKRLNYQYNQRNRVIHRYIISDILTKDVMEIVNEYLSLENEINEIEMNIEKQQVELKKGILGSQENLLSTQNREEELGRMIASIGDKHAIRSFNKNIVYKKLRKGK